MLFRLLCCQRDNPAEYEVEPFVITAFHVVDVGVFLHHKQQRLLAMRVRTYGTFKSFSLFCIPAVALFALRGLRPQRAYLFGYLLAHGGAYHQKVLHKPTGLPRPDAW